MGGGRGKILMTKGGTEYNTEFQRYLGINIVPIIFFKRIGWRYSLLNSSSRCTERTE